MKIAVSLTTTGFPLFYAIKAYGTVISGIIASERIPVGNYKKYLSYLERKIKNKQIINKS